MRIGIDARLADYRLGGTARYTVELARHIERLQTGHQIIAARARRPRVAPPDIPAHESIAVRTPPHHFAERYALSWELRHAHLDVLHSPDFIAPRANGWRSVITVHDLAFLRMPWLVTPAARRYYGAVRGAVREADAVIAVSQSTADDLLELTPVDADRIHVIHEAADSELGPMAPDEAARLVEERHNIVGPYVLFVGTIEPRKNLPTLLQAFSLLRREFPARLVVAGGSGWLSDDVFDTVRRLALADGVVFLGDVSPSHLRALYCAARVLAQPSLYEGFGLPPLEAMACGTPVVVSRAGALPEIVGDAGVFVNPSDPNDIAHGLGWVLGNDAFRAALAQRGIARAATYSWDRVARQTVAVYEGVVGL